MIEYKSILQVLKPFLSGILRPPAYDVSSAPAIGPPPKEYLEGEHGVVGGAPATDGGKDQGEEKTTGHAQPPTDMGEIPVHDT